MFIAVLLSMVVETANEPNIRPFAIRVVDEQTGRGVPLVELRTINNLRFCTDSNGLVAFHEPGLMDRDVYFTVKSHGYEFAKDGFGFRGKMLHTTPGQEAKLSIKRINIAERLYRVTGGGIYSDSVLLGEKFPIKEPALNAQVLGSDSVLSAVYGGKIHWFWGDTNRPSYPLGNFDTPGAISQLPSNGGLDPDRGVDLSYYADAKGFAKGTLKMPGKGPTWMTSLIPLKDKDGKERLYCSFVKIEGSMKVYSRGLAVWNDKQEQFDKLSDIDMKAPIFPEGHAFIHGDHVYFSHPFPLMRVPATAEGFQNPAAYECYTCLKEGSTLETPEFDRDADGKLRYSWKKNSPYVGPAEEAKMKLKDRSFELRDRYSGKAVTPHRGTVYWNAYRKKWILIATEIYGTSVLGEVWFAEAPEMTGPWRDAVKIVTHEKYSFYNPKQHPMFDKDGGKIIYFEGTYTHSFSGNTEQTPRYDYNQIMYKLDLSDKRLVMLAKP